MSVDAAGSTTGSSLRRRVISAAIAVPIMVIAVLVLPTGIIALILAIIAIGASFEWMRVTTGRTDRGRGFALIVAGSLLLSWLAGPMLFPWLQFLCAVSLVWWCVALVWVVRFEQGLDAVALDGRAMQIAIGWLVIVPAWAGLVYLHAAAEDGPQRVLFVLCIVWVTDSVAFFVGRRFGVHRLAAITSPGKTVEGAAGAVAAVIVLGAGVGLFMDLSVGLIAIFTVLCVAVAVLSILGDLMESLAKRRSGLKDSGNVLPGHGGILDRIDSLTAAAPAFAIGYDTFGVLR